MIKNFPAQNFMSGELEGSWSWVEKGSPGLKLCDEIWGWNVQKYLLDPTKKLCSIHITVGKYLFMLVGPFVEEPY